MKDNKGITLVEILVALSVGAVLLTGLSSMLMTSLNITEKSNLKVDLQQEGQITLSLISDTFMEATGLKIVQNALSGQTEVVYLGEFISYNDGANDRMRYEGIVILNRENVPEGWWELYVAEYQFPSSNEMSVLAGADDSRNKGNLEAKILEDMTSAGALVGELKYLLAQHITDFAVEVELEDLVPPNDIYKGNITLKFNVDFENIRGNSSSTSVLTDSVQLRNRVELVELDKGDGSPIEIFTLH